MNGILSSYRTRVRANVTGTSADDGQDLRYWQDWLFCDFLVYCLPVSLIALIPGVVMALKDGYPVIALVDLASFILIVLVTFLPGIPLRYRKIWVITVFYILAVFLIDTLGYVGPGVFYLFLLQCWPPLSSPYAMPTCRLYPIHATIYPYPILLMME